MFVVLLRRDTAEVGQSINAEQVRSLPGFNPRRQAPRR